MFMKLEPKAKERNERWIAHYGGSFNPVHNGHIALAEKLLRDYGFDQVVFFLNGDQYGKNGLAPESARYALVEAAIAGRRGMSVDDFELRQGRELIYTADSIKYLHAKYAAEGGPFKLFCIRGADAVVKMLTWKSLSELIRYCTILVVPRDDIDWFSALKTCPACESYRDHLLEMDSTGIPPVSSTVVRRAIYANPQADIPVPSAVRDQMRTLGMYGLVPDEESEILLYRPGYSGGLKRDRDRDRDEWYGAGHWRTAFRWGQRLISYDEALMLYEDAYLAFFKQNPDDLDWLCQTASDVFDNSDSNVLCGTDYSAQEAMSTHLQDIAVRSCLIRLGRVFEGDHLVEIRDRHSEGFRLNPGQIMFHRPELIVQPEHRSWWKEGSIESFWQANKVFLVKQKAFSPERPLIIHMVVYNATKDVLAIMDNNRVRAMPFCTYEGGVPYRNELEPFLNELGVNWEDIKPASAEPVRDESGIHIIWTATAATAVSRDGFEFVALQKAKSQLRQKSLKKLLRSVT